MIAIYRNLLRLYPKRYRREFAEEMTTVFAEVDAEAMARGPAARFKFVVFEAAGLFCGAMQERWREFGMRRFSMRGDFRFPKMTWVLMMIILVGVLLAINKGEAISVSVAPTDQPVGAIHPASTVISSWTLSFLLMYVIGALVGGAVFLLRRSKAKPAME
ncbi:MAG TPA: hypothetical protein VMX38_07730 [Verrucomicrobiae bacterium]|jgi:hypothetical protein|nr:hypothetical protein [Verrucomicrobiae bacterium]